MLTKNNTKPKSLGSNGFTLIELLVVIIIIGILAGIAVIGVSGARNSAQKAACKTDASQLIKALRVFSAANGEKIPVDGTATNDVAFPTTSTTITYSGVKRLWEDPDAKFLENPLYSYLGSGTTSSAPYVLIAGLKTDGSLIVVGSDKAEDPTPSFNVGFTGTAADKEFGGDCNVTG